MFLPASGPNGIQQITIKWDIKAECKTVAVKYLKAVSLVADVTLLVTGQRMVSSLIVVIESSKSMQVSYTGNCRRLWMKSSM